MLDEVLVFLPGEGLVVEGLLGLQLLHHMIVLSLHPGVFLVHHGNLLVLVELVVGHRTALQLGVVVGKRLVLLQQLLVAVLPHSPRLLLVFLVVVDVLVLVDRLLHLLQQHPILVPSFSHHLHQHVVFVLKSHPVVLVVHLQERLSQYR